MRGNECSCKGTVRYGADTKFHYKKAVVGKITCAKNNFDGDPIKQTSKKCYCLKPDKPVVESTDVDYHYGPDSLTQLFSTNSSLSAEQLLE